MTADVRLREVRDADLPAFFEHQFDRGAAGESASGRDPRDWPKFVEHWTRVRADAGVVIRTIAWRDEVAGYVATFMREGCREVSYWLGSQYRGRGTATRALRALLALVPERPLYARTVAGNAASIRVLEKCGFVQVMGNDRPAPADDSEADEVVLRLSAEA